MEKLFVNDVVRVLKSWAPVELAEPWDNVGLLVGHLSQPVEQIMTCLTLTSDVAAEAIERGADLVVSHHPLLFRPVQRLTSETIEGKLLLDLIAAGVAVYSPHTSFDSASDGINQLLAEELRLGGIQPLRPIEVSDRPADERAGKQNPGAGRWGDLAQAMTLQEFLSHVKTRMKIENLQYVGQPEHSVKRVGIACGSAAEFMTDAKKDGCDVLLTGEARFHASLEARELGIGLVLIGHYASERPAMQVLADRLDRYFPQFEVWASRVESDPLQWG